MFYYFLYPLKDFWFGYNVFKYITFRASMAAVTSFIICLLIGPLLIKLLANFKLGQIVRKEHVEKLKDFHNSKEGTPTMGGVLIIASVVLSSLLWSDLSNGFVLLILSSMVWLGMIGFLDDYIKIKNKNSKGVAKRYKLLGQCVLALIIGAFVVKNPAIGSELNFPFFKNVIINIGYFYIPFVLIVIVGSSNAVNLTDGLDGLAVGCTLFVAITYAIMAYVTGNIVLSEYLQVFYLPGSGEITCVCAALIGASLGFLWFNCHPATVFMGDTGSLSLGGTMAVISVLLKKEFLLLIVGGIFVIETLSVIIQVYYFKRTGKRKFLMSPIHHHFQLKGLPETKITVRFWIVAAIFALIGIASLKVR
ncbi:MAG: phospho-N-acetylmuramoyl-pentapeptide-transferase [Candidatus Omnitrophica bacterium]|nr:phospho-N-acetylmuramoyl-pentapeptide-transferase [Candidatus Omnitrophota bacterium]